MHDTFDDGLVRELLDALPIGLMILKEGRILAVNERLAVWLQCPREALLGLDAAASGPLGLSALFDGREEFSFEAGAEERRLHRQQRALADGTLAHFFDDRTPQAELCRERDRFREKAESLDPVDHDTGLPNRAAILRSLDEEVSRSRRYGNPLSVIRLTLSAEEGGAPTPALREFAQVLKAELRWVDQIGRYEPASLLLVLPETPAQAAEKLAEKLGRGRAALAIVERFSLDVAVSGWQVGDDTRKLLQRLGRATAPN
jgi:GGDEF domain-containing protein